jgi:hypothetical protein
MTNRRAAARPSISRRTARTRSTRGGDDRYFQHSIDEEWADQLASDEFAPDGEFEADGEDESLHL